ncbi:response regulator [Malikia sp.]|uniref:response regulator n=1 Tax=Malikia sp. TaxID=2070706 RepID=UPI00260B94E5|nr:response regulator [Malikia sp.]MDD2729994.1 response regulator [Malikia sp.]
MARPLQILVADDDALNLRVAARLLREQGCSGALVTSGDKALQLIAQREFDLMLLDISMPQMDGAQTLRALRERERQDGRHLPVVMVSGFEDRATVERFLAAGADGFLVKPLAADSLRAEIRRVTRG